LTWYGKDKSVNVLHRIDMKNALVTAVLAHGLGIANAATGAPPHSHFSYFDGNQYAFIISEEKYATMRFWSPKTGESPPVSPGRALQLAEERLGKIPVPKNYGWEVEAVALEPINVSSPDGKWMYVVKFRYCMNGPTTGVWPTLDFIVTMDGELVEPVVSNRQPSR
jgi:hypothetical protein